MKKKPLILIVDDETAILKTLQESLEDEGYHIQILPDGNKIIETIGSLVPDLVLLDIFMPNCNGLKLLKDIAKLFPLQHVIIMSGFGTIQIALEAVKNGALDFIEKPLNLDEVLEKIAFLKKNSIHDEFLYQPKPYDFEDHGIIGRSYLFLELMNYIRTIAPFNLPTIIYGGKGVGKSLMACFIHKKSSFAMHGFTIIDCSNQTILQPSLFERKGTLFLKNIHELPKESQQFVLDSLNKKARIIGSSNSNLFSLAQSGRFNMSLFCRLQSLPVEIPSLNKRRQDIPLLVDHFISKANEKNNTATTLTPAAIRLLRNHHWPHNITQLKEYIFNLVELADHPQKVFGARDLLSILPEKDIAFVDEQVFLRFNSLDEATSSFQRTYLLHLLTRHRYNLHELSIALSLNISQLRDKMMKLDINVV